MKQPAFAFYDQPLSTSQPRPVTPEGQERIRTGKAKDRVLARLQQGPAYNWELCAPDCGGLGGVRRCWELSKTWQIEKHRVGDSGTWLYELKGRR